MITTINIHFDQDFQAFDNGFHNCKHHIFVAMIGTQSQSIQEKIEEIYHIFISLD
jgi:hypothetical protein